MLQVQELCGTAAAILVLAWAPHPASASAPTGTDPDDMAKVPASEFFSGCNPQVDTECYDSEKPGKQRYLESFWIDLTEVTVASYSECVDAKACGEPDTGSRCNWGVPGREKHPVNCVDWHQAKTYCGWKKKRLPSEWEWEKAARGTDGRKYPWGNRDVGSSPRAANIGGEEDGHRKTAPVGTFPDGVSPYGVEDMVGNVWEWTASFQGEKLVLRGGSWNSRPRAARASNRNWNVPQRKGGGDGFRCAK